ncbi:hypothetical protein ACVIHF_000601 [Bradyrhizobium sp. USDA 4506]
MNWVGGDAGKNVREPGLRIDAIHFGRDDQAIHGSRAPSAAIRAAEQPGFSSKSDASQASFGGIVGEANPLRRAVTDTNRGPL